MAAYGESPVPHRSARIEDVLYAVRELLKALTGAQHVALMPGSGTLANDMIAQQLCGKGVVIANGEFGARLVTQAFGAGHQPLVVSHASEIDRACDWIWAVHCETSTGEMTDVDALRATSERFGAKLYLDCVSTIGAVPFKMDGIAMASFSSGKGLASVAGVSGVLIGDQAWFKRTATPRCLDIVRATGSAAMCTFPSGPLLALREALRLRREDRFETIAQSGAHLRDVLSREGVTVTGDAPHILTVRVPDRRNARNAADELRRRGFLVSSGSDYLVRANTFQIALFGHVPAPAALDLVRAVVKTAAC